jgi:hypothetical protein
MTNWRGDNPRAFWDQVDRSNPQTTRLGTVRCTCERFCWYSPDDLRGKIEPPSCRQYKPGDFLGVRPLNWDKKIQEDDDNDKWAYPTAPSGGRSRCRDGNDNDDNEGEEDDMQGSEKGTGKGNGTNDGKGKAKGNGKGKATEEGKGKENGNSKWEDIIRQTPGGDDISCAVIVQLQKEMYQAASDTEG